MKVKRHALVLLWLRPIVDAYLTRMISHQEYLTILIPHELLYCCLFQLDLFAEFKQFCFIKAEFILLMLAHLISTAYTEHWSIWWICQVINLIFKFLSVSGLVRLGIPNTKWLVLRDWTELFIIFGMPSYCSNMRLMSFKLALLMEWSSLQVETIQSECTISSSAQ